MSARATLALMRASWLTARSYRVAMVVSVLSLALTVVPVFYVARALQPLMARSIANEGAQFFGFILVGTVTLSLITVAMNALPGAIGGGIGSGFFEALLASPTPLPAILAGQSAYEATWVLGRGAVLLLVGWLLGAPVHWGRVPEALVVVALLVAAYLAVGLVAGALTLAFRTTARLTQGVLLASILLGGAYYPTGVLPEPIRPLAVLVPLTYGLRAVRRVLLQGVPLSGVLGDVGMLLVFVAVLGAVGVAAFLAALRYARRTGSLAQY